MTDPELRELRRRLDSILRGRGRRIPLELRTQVTAWVAKHRKRGESWSELVRKTGISMLSLQRWSASPARRAVMLRRVEVAEAITPELPHRPAPTSGSPLRRRDADRR